MPYRSALSDNVGLFDFLAFVGLFSGSILIMRVVLEVLRSDSARNDEGRGRAR